MTSLSIKFSAVHGEDRVAARVRRIDIDGDYGDDWFRDLRIAPDEATTLEIDPGHYVFEAFWRDGRLTTQQCVIGTSSSELVLVPPRRRREPKPSDRDFSRPSAGGMFLSSRSSTGANPHTVFRSDLETWTLLSDTQRIESESKMTNEHIPVRRQQDVKIQSDICGARHWVVYCAADAWMLSSLPFTGAGNEGVTLRVDPQELPFIKASDPDLGMMTDMLPAGNAEAAHRYASVAYTHAQSNDLRHIISTRPLELCAFAYAEHDLFAESAWTTALASSEDWHGLISDISVLKGWRLLMTAKGTDDWRRAGMLFERAVETGVPYYSLGVKLLAEGLTMIASSMPEHDRSAELVRAVASRVIPSEAFTTVRF